MLEKGTKVRIKSLDWYNQNKDEEGRVIMSDKIISFTPEMMKYCGKEATIDNIDIGYYQLDIDHHDSYWSKDMFNVIDN